MKKDKKLDSQVTGIDTIEKISIFGIEQWISLRSKNCDNPLILFLHGGPGTAQISFARKIQHTLEDHFIVVNWDQRGAGRSYSKSLRKADMTIDQMVRDTEGLIENLLQRFKQTKIFIIGHSWGSIIGINLVAKRPDFIFTYIGIGQVVNMMRGEELSYQFTLDEANRLRNKRAIRELHNIGNPPYKKLSDAGIQQKWLSKFHGVSFKGSGVGTLLKNFSLKDTRPIDLVKFVQGAIFSLTSLESEQLHIDFLSSFAKLDVPVIFCCGRRDYNTPSELVSEYFEKLEAPQKEIVWFERSAHLPNFEEPGKFCDLCISLLRKG